MTDDPRRIHNVFLGVATLLLGFTAALAVALVWMNRTGSEPKDIGDIQQATVLLVRHVACPLLVLIVLAILLTATCLMIRNGFAISNVVGAQRLAVSILPWLFFIVGLYLQGTDTSSELDMSMRALLRELAWWKLLGIGIFLGFGAGYELYLRSEGRSHKLLLILLCFISGVMSFSLYALASAGPTAGVMLCLGVLMGIGFYSFVPNPSEAEGSSEPAIWDAERDQLQASKDQGIATDQHVSSDVSDILSDRRQGNTEIASNLGDSEVHDEE